ncbi:MAG: DUF3572 family protein [Proteobacteria bacterium]|nr:DUF3572 family protein [Pseudomonadota bacterium]MBI3496571.1 DUF3572 family protein [Pseudomonadota bacterium]
MLPSEYSADTLADQPETLAIRVLGFLMSSRSGLSRLLSHAGLAEADLRRRPVATQHLAAVLDFLITDEALLMGFTRAVELSPESLYEARRRLRLAAAFATRGVAPALSWRVAGGALAGALRR